MNAKELFEKEKRFDISYGLATRINTQSITWDAPIIQPNVSVSIGKECFFEESISEKPFLRTKPDTQDKASLYHGAFESYRYRIVIPKHSEKTVIVHQTHEGSSAGSILIDAQEGSQAHIIIVQKGIAPVHSCVLEVQAKDRSKVQCAIIQDLSQESNDFIRCHAEANTEAKIDWFICTRGSSISRANVTNNLLGEESHVRSYGIFLGDNNQQFDLSAKSMHKGNRSISDMHTKGVLRGKSKSIYTGLIDIDEQAYGCNGYQKEHALLLSPTAVADAIPNLQIRNNDVKCSHGATIGRIDEEQLFYLTSRGVTQKEAIQLLVQGFVRPLVSSLNWPALDTYIEPIVEDFSL